MLDLWINESWHSEVYRQAILKYLCRLCLLSGAYESNIALFVQEGRGHSPISQKPDWQIIIWYEVYLQASCWLKAEPRRGIASEEGKLPTRIHKFPQHCWGYHYFLPWELQRLLLFQLNYPNADREHIPGVGSGLQSLELSGSGKSFASYSQQHSVSLHHISSKIFLEVLWCPNLKFCQDIG